MTATQIQTMRERLDAAIGPWQAVDAKLHLELVLAEILRVKENL